MKFTKYPYTVKSTDNVHTLNGIIYVPIGTVKATVQIIHGMSEHIELYDELMSILAENGIAAFAHDQVGHGRTAESLDKLGFIAEENGSQLLVDDAYQFAKDIIADYTGIKHFVFGHSMGSFTTRLCSEQYPDMADGIILAGTSGPQKAAPLGIYVTDVKSMVQGGEHRSVSAQRLFCDIYNLEFREEDEDYSWLTSDQNVIAAHENDELFNFTYSIKGMNDVVRLCTLCNSDEWFANYRADCPALIISGENDPLGNFGKGVLEIYKRLKEKAGDKITFKLYSSARHELLNESCKYGVISDILKWIEMNIKD